MNAVKFPSGNIPLPKGWPKYSGKAIMAALAMMRMTLAHLRDWSLNHDNPGIVREGEIERLTTENRALREVIDILQQRLEMAKVKPQCTPELRAKVLELKAMTGWTNETIGKIILVCGGTIGRWFRRFCEQEEDGNQLVRFPPVNEFPKLLDYFVGRTNDFCPHFGKEMISRLFIRAGVHAAPNSVGKRMKARNNPHKPAPPPSDSPDNDNEEGSESVVENEKIRVINAKRPMHTIHVDFTIVPNTGMCVPWEHGTLDPVYPYCYWVGAVVDHFSRKNLGFGVFHKEPSAEETAQFLDKVFDRYGKPDHIISDKGGYFFCDYYQKWCKAKGIQYRYGKAGEHGSIAVVERYIKSMKNEGIAFANVSQNEDRFREELALYVMWYNEYRPHQYLKGRTPNEVFEEVEIPATMQPRFELRPKWPERSGCAGTDVPIKGKPGIEPIMQIAFLEGRRHLPIITFLDPDELDDVA
jgi:transposase InsO family protein